MKTLTSSPAALLLPSLLLTATAVSAQEFSVSLRDSSRPEITVLPPAPLTPYERMLPLSSVLSERQSTLPGGHRRSALLHTPFKYPLLRVLEDFKNGSTRPVCRMVMVADHLLTRVNAAERPALEIFLLRYPQVKVRARLSTGEHVLLQIPDFAEHAALEKWQNRLHNAGLSTAGPDYLRYPDALPNDLSFSSLWHLNNTGLSGGLADADVDAPEAWDIVKGSHDVKVAIIDTGLDYLHEDLYANIWTGADGTHGHDYYDNDDDPYEGYWDDGHGTHVAGIVAATGNNFTGITGTAWQADMMGLRFLGPFGGATSDGIQCIRHATDHGVRIINNSWGSSGGFLRDALGEEIADARSKGALMLCSAGNDGTSNEIYPHYPSNYTHDNVISIAATDRRDAIWLYSNYGATSVDLAAPGKDVYSTLPEDYYETKSGTSMATPLVTGAAVLAMAANSDFTWLDVRTRILNGVDPLPGLTGKMVTGGRLNVNKPINDFRGTVLKLSRRDITYLSGNNDLYTNPGEILRLDLILRNDGSQAASSSTVSAALSAGAPATLNRSSLPAGAVGARSSVLLNDAFRLTVNSNAVTPAPFTVTFTISSPAMPQAKTETLNLTVYTAATVSGRVTRASTGAPLSGATVAFRGSVNFDLTTAADGRFTARTVAGPCEITATSTGLVPSAPHSVTLASANGDIDFQLGTASLTLNPETLTLNVPAGQSRTFYAHAAHTGDSPRAIPIQPVLTGSGLGLDRLYGLALSPPALQEIDAATGELIAVHPYPAPAATVTGVAWHQGIVWQLLSDWGVQPPRQWLRPLTPGTWAPGTDIPLTPPADSTFAGLGSTGANLLLTTRDNSGAAYALHEFVPATSTLTPAGALPANALGPVSGSLARGSVFVALNTGAGSAVAEYSWPDLTHQREWTVANTAITGLACNDEQAGIYLTALPQSGGASILTLHDPLTGTPISSFTAVSGPSFPAVATAGGPGWLNAPASAAVPRGTTYQLPLTVNTAGISPGRTFTAQLALVPEFAEAPAPVSVQVNVIEPVPDSTWEGWFTNRFGTAPTPADRSGDPDRDGIPTLIEFLTGGDPQNATRHAGAPVLQSAAGNSLQFIFHQRRGQTAGALLAQAAANLSGWTELPAAIPGSTASSTEVDSDFDRINITIPLTSGPARFLRLAAP